MPVGTLVITFLESRKALVTRGAQWRQEGTDLSAAGMTQGARRGGAEMPAFPFCVVLGHWTAELSRLQTRLGMKFFHFLVKPALAFLNNHSVRPLWQASFLTSEEGQVRSDDNWPALRKHKELCCSKYGPRTITWELVRNTGSQAPPQIYESEPAFEEHIWGYQQGCVPSRGSEREGIHFLAFSNL